jgi:hypothetical protein
LAGRILNTVVKEYENSELNFHATHRGGAKALIFWLNAGKASKVRA